MKKYIGVAAISVLFFLVQLGFLISNKWTLLAFKKQVASDQSSSPAAPTVPAIGLEEFAAGAAKTAGLKQLLSLRTEERGVTQTEWEGAPASGVKFLDLLRTHKNLGSCRSLQISSGQENTLVRVRAVFGPGNVPTLAIAASSSNNKDQRNVFASLWPIVSPSNEDLRLNALRKEQEDRRKQEEKSLAERKVQDEIDRLASKRKQLETNLILTGVVNNGRETLAFVNNKGSGNSTVMLRNGDVIEEARVTNIEAARGELQLDYMGKFQVSLKINSGQRGSY